MAGVLRWCADNAGWMAAVVLGVGAAWLVFLGVVWYLSHSD